MARSPSAPLPLVAMCLLLGCKSDTSVEETDTDTDTYAPWAGTWSGQGTLEVEEGGFVPTQGSCTVQVVLEVSDDTDLETIGTGQWTCQPMGMGESSWEAMVWSASATSFSGAVEVAASPDGTETYTGASELAASLEGDTAHLTLTAGSTEGGGEWSLSWEEATLDLTRE